MLTKAIGFRGISLFCSTKLGNQTMQDRLSQCISQTLLPKHFQIYNESHMHSRGRQTHYRMVIVSQQFQNLSKLRKQQLVFEKLGQLMPKIHALTLTCWTPQQYMNTNKSENKSPGCVHQDN